MLFVPAGTIDFWQAWGYLFIFGASVSLIFVYLYKHDPGLLERRLNRAEKEKSQQGIQRYIFIAYMAVFILPALDHRWAWSDVPWLIVITGDVLVALGNLIIFLALKENSFAAATIEVTPDQKVISTGPYAVIRHPMYSGAIVMLLGTPLALGSWWGLLIFILIAGMIVWRLHEEEKFLFRSLSGYKDYCQKVRYRLIPFIW
jgi:protein-S-isoprenylcysteine O-methyltransferase Ste14